MLNENIKKLRLAHGLSQEELAEQCHVVRQTISKWENGLSVPDAEMLLCLANILQSPVSTLLGETLQEESPDTIALLSEKLERINATLAQRKKHQRKTWHYFCIALFLLLLCVCLLLLLFPSPYFAWDYSKDDPDYMGVSLHIAE